MRRNRPAKTPNRPANRRKNTPDVQWPRGKPQRPGGLSSKPVCGLNRVDSPAFWWDMHFEWDEQKNQLNLATHGIDFETAILCWEDSSGFDVWDEWHSTYEEARWLKFGRLPNGKVVCVVYTELTENHCRIISAFSDGKIERTYYEGQRFGR